MEHMIYSVVFPGLFIGRQVPGVLHHHDHAVKISPEAVDPDDVEMLEDMIVAAANEAFHQMEEASSAVMAELTGGLGGLGGLSF